MKHLEARGVIRAYRDEIDLRSLGRPLHVYLRVLGPPSDSRFRKKIESLDAIFECHHVTGTESFVLRAAIDSVLSLEELIQQLSGFGPTTTSVILSTMLDRRHFVPIQK